MQETADSLSSRKFFSDAQYNEGWYKSESIFLQKKDRLSFVPTFIILGVTKEFLARTGVSCPLHPRSIIIDYVRGGGYIYIMLWVRICQIDCKSVSLRCRMLGNWWCYAIMSEQKIEVGGFMFEFVGHAEKRHSSKINWWTDLNQFIVGLIFYTNKTAGGELI